MSTTAETTEQDQGTLAESIAVPPVRRPSTAHHSESPQTSSPRRSRYEQHHHQQSHQQPLQPQKPHHVHHRQTYGDLTEHDLYDQYSRQTTHHLEHDHHQAIHRERPEYAQPQPVRQLQVHFEPEPEPQPAYDPQVYQQPQQYAAYYQQQQALQAVPSVGSGCGVHGAYLGLDNYATKPTPQQHSPIASTVLIMLLISGLLINLHLAIKVNYKYENFKRTVIALNTHKEFVINALLTIIGLIAIFAASPVMLYFYSFCQFFILFSLFAFQKVDPDMKSIVLVNYAHLTACGALALQLGNIYSELYAPGEAMTISFNFQSLFKREQGAPGEAV